MSRTFEKGIHYYLVDTRVVFTEIYHLERGYCCGSVKDGCRHCPYEPKGQRGNTKVKEKDKNSDE